MPDTQISPSLAAAIDEHLAHALTVNQGLQGVVAGVTGPSAGHVGAAGVRTAGSDAAMAPDSVFCIFSTTKAITATAVLQCVEDGLVDLDAPVTTYLPEWGELQVIEGFDAAGAPQLRPPATQATVRNLLTHTAGLAYDFFNDTYAKLAEQGQPSVITGTKASLMTPLLFDPGAAWCYGTNIDWAGLVVEKARGKRLGEVFAERIFAPAGMTNSAFGIADSRRDRLVPIHARMPDGSLAPTDIELPPDAEVHNGGHGLYSTVEDYLAFLRVWLNDGEGPNGRVLSAATVAEACKNQLGDLSVVDQVPSTNPQLTNPVDLYPGVRKGWTLPFMITEDPLPTGRPAGALAWAGLANLYYWLDRENGVAGLWATQIFPFWDPTSLEGFATLEALTYKNL